MENKNKNINGAETGTDNTENSWTPTDISKVVDQTETFKEVDESYEKYIREKNESGIKTDLKTLIGVIIGSLVAAANLKLFVNAGGLTPGGVTGVVVLIQRCFERFLGITLPFSPLSLLFNLLPALVAFRIIGKKYTAFSFLSIVIFSFATDLIPDMTVTKDPLLISLFGGILSGLGSALVLNSGASQGGTDFIAMSISVKKGISVFNYVMGFNICLLLISGFLFGMEPALYTIIYQFVATQVLNTFYKRYEKKTLLVVTNRPVEVSMEVRMTTNHTSTILDGEGGYSGQNKYIVYLIVGAEELNLVRRHIRAVDPNAFINVINSDMVTGKFYIRPIGS